MGAVFGASCVHSLIISLPLSALPGGPPTLVRGLVTGALAGIGGGAAALGTLYLFERKSLGLFLINAGYHTVRCTPTGGILGVRK